LRGFVSFCALFGVAFPPTGQSGVDAVLAWWTLVLVNGLKFASIRASSAGILDYYETARLPSPTRNFQCIRRFKRLEMWCQYHRPVVRAPFIAEGVLLRVKESFASAFGAWDEQLALLGLLYVTGARIDSVCHLCPEDVAFGRFQLNIWWLKIKWRRGEKLERVYDRASVDWPGWAEALEMVVARFACGERVFGKWSAERVSVLLRERCALAGLVVVASASSTVITSYSLRRTRARLVYRRTKSKEAVSAVLMHKDASSVAAYLELTGTFSPPPI
jgi:integrase